MKGSTGRGSGIRRRIIDLFKSIFKNRKSTKFNLSESYTPKISKEFQPDRKAPRSRWIITHNSIQAKSANKLRKRRKANKVAGKQRQINRKAA